MIHDEDFMNQCGVWLRSTRPPLRTPRNFQTFLNNSVLPTLTGSLVCKVSESTARRWMIHAGYKYGSWKKDVFMDGHERSDVVEYRKYFCKSWLSLIDQMVSFSGPEMDVVEPPLDLSRQVVWVTHDESIFYANDDGGRVWTNKAHPDIPKKGRGRSIMVSDFLCPCHGRLYMPNGDAKQFVTEVLHVGKDQEGFWTSDHVIMQVVNKSLPAFTALHPGCVAFFTFDQSTNHAAFAADALRVSSMNLYPGGKKPPMRAGWFGTPRQTQSMVFPDDHVNPSLHGLPKGIKTVLIERDCWRDSFRLFCGASVDLPPAPAVLQCCARHCLACHDDFRAQKSVLEETVVAAGHTCLFFPKYHCELNPIESYWCFAKRFARTNCDYSWDGLVRCVPRSLQSVPLSSIRKFFRRCAHFIQAYSYGLDYNMSKYAHKQYKSHRRIPASIAQSNFGE
ncbi:Aste57867_18360 [Aphanomyces stellatus]|uniref:Aste57867_18360 protein n=1 Tax=Aphanomyces stellatus TaxID=120398 RepID=A0A485LA54_9STRA|nr:hypothetical protein As57867_018298 [Aphanomyces stellatus]VFT95096.1 Aste57867_18360 [Aphanomyces stellatus]